MWDFPSHETVERIKNQYKEGSRVELVHMDDFHAPPVGTQGTVEEVDDIGTIHVKWDNGLSLGVCYPEDYCKLV